jgi:hypothetical protein
MKSTGLFVALFAWITVACSSTNSSIESAQFHLDQAEYTEAITILTDIVEADSTNYKAAALLASAYFGRGFLGEDGSYLGVFSDFLEGQQSGKSEMQSVAAVTPSAAKEGKADIYAAIDLLEGIPTDSRTKENYLQLAFSQLAVVAIVGAAQIGALDSEDPCALDFSGTTNEDETRFNDSIDNVNANFENAGIEDFSTTGLGEELADINTQLDAAADLQAFLEDQFGVDGAGC